VKSAAFLVGATLALVGGAAGAYDLGSLTCDDMGNFGRDAMVAMGKGTNKDDYLKSLEAREFKVDIDRRNAKDIAELIYGKLGTQLYDDKAAFSVIKTDCLSGRKR